MAGRSAVNGEVGIRMKHHRIVDAPMPWRDIAWFGVAYLALFILAVW